MSCDLRFEVLRWPYLSSSSNSSTPLNICLLFRWFPFPTHGGWCNFFLICVCFFKIWVIWLILLNIWLYKVVSLPHTWRLVQWNERPFYSSPITIITAICPYWIQWFYPLHIIVREIIPLRWTTTECIQLRKWKTKRITQPLKENGIKVLENIERYDKRCDTDFMSWNSWHRKSAPHLRTELDFCTIDKPTQQHKFVRMAPSSEYISFLFYLIILCCSEE